MSAKLSIVILSYNTKDLLKNCLESLKARKGEINFEVIIVDNGSSDGSPKMVKKHYSWTRLVENRKNLGFAKGNNEARSLCEGEFVLFLNSDTVVFKDALNKTVSFIEKNLEVGALTCKLTLPNGDLDRDTRRSFITPWVGFTHLFLRLDRLFPKSRIFSRYWYGYIDPNTTHEVDVLQGAFFLTRKSVLDKVGWFDEDYFLDGEDIDLSWKIKQEGWKIMYYPEAVVLHIKGASKGKNKKFKSEVSLKEKLKFNMAGVNSMEIFLKKRLWKKYPPILNYTTLLGIKLVKLGRLVGVLIFG